MRISMDGRGGYWDDINAPGEPGRFSARLGIGGSHGPIDLG